MDHQACCRWLGMEEGMAIEDKRISKGILRAQKKVEERNFLARKNLLEYDEVMDHQRTTFYGMRQKVLLGREIDKVIWDMISQAIDDAVDKYIVEDHIANVLVEWARARPSRRMIEPEDFRGMRRLEEIEELIKDPRPKLRRRATSPRRWASSWARMLPTRKNGITKGLSNVGHDSFPV